MRNLTLPLRNENKKLIIDNNFLHKDIMLLKDDYYKKEIEAINDIKKLQVEADNVF